MIATFFSLLMSIYCLKSWENSIRYLPIVFHFVLWQISTSLMLLKDHEIAALQ
jgi:hypothetical protein